MDMTNISMLLDVEALVEFACGIKGRDEQPPNRESELPSPMAPIGLGNTFEYK